MLGDGHLSRRGRKPSSKTNARYEMTMKTTSHSYMVFLIETVFNIFNPKISPWPNILLPQHIGKEVQHYYFATKANTILTELHSIWYV